MKVILNDHIDHLGERGDVVSVKPGYARNYLLPKRLAYIDAPGNRRRFKEDQTNWEEMDLARRSAADKIAAEMDGTELIFERRASEKDVLFGSVTSLDVARSLAERGFEIDRRRVLLEHPIKEIGSFEVDVQVHREIKVTIPVHVVRPGGQPDPGHAGAKSEVEAAAIEPDVTASTPSQVIPEASEQP